MASLDRGEKKGNRGKNMTWAMKVQSKSCWYSVGKSLKSWTQSLREFKLEEFKKLRLKCVSSTISRNLKKIKIKGLFQF